MDTPSSRVAGRLAGARGQKFAARRQELATQATSGLAELGFARASMRELAQHCEISLGVLHYYFDDKDDLVMCCVRQYKNHFIDRYNSIVIDGSSGPELKTRISSALSNSLRESAAMHRLWYDLRTQALFEDFTRAFNGADVLLVTDVYPAGEAPIVGATGEALADAIRAHGHHAVSYVKDKKNVTAALRAVVKPGDLVIALGAGDINQSARELLRVLSGGPESA